MVNIVMMKLMHVLETRVPIRAFVQCSTSLEGSGQYRGGEK